MMLWLLVDAALRALMLGAAVWLGLKLLRVRNPEVELTAWTIVLAVALAMPLLVRIAVVTVPARLPVPASVVDIMPASPSAPFETSVIPVEPYVATPAQTIHRPIDWRALGEGFYLLVAGMLLLRLSTGVAMLWRVSRRARPVLADGSDVRISRDIGMPVTFGRIILLPADCPRWPAVKLQAVLSHERSHVARADYVVLLLAAFHRAIFWFNPLSWWLLRRLAALMETASDDAAIADLRDRVSYAEILLDIAAAGGRSTTGVAMARPATVAGRIARILRENALPMRVGWRKRVLVAASLIPATAIAAVTIAQSAPAGLPPVAEDLTVLSGIELASLPLDPLNVNPFAPPRVQFQALPVFLEMPAAFPAVPRSPATLADVQLSSSPAEQSSDTAGTSSEPKPPEGAKPVDMRGTWTMLARGVVESCTFKQAGNKLGGTCKTTFGDGPVRGLIDGQKVEWRWLYKAGNINYVRDFKVAVFDATLLSDNRLEGGYHIYHTYDKFNPSFRIQDSHLIPRLPGPYFTAEKQPSGSP
jgi:hypothetical protein